MKQLSFLPEVPSQEILEEHHTEQLNLFPASVYLGKSSKSSAIKPVLTEAKCWYQGKVGKIEKRFTERFDDLPLKFCVVRFEDGAMDEILESHLTIL